MKMMREECYSDIHGRYHFSYGDITFSWKKSVIYIHGDIYHFSTLAQCDITLAYHNTQV
jgi:hypothetical protein